MELPSLAQNLGMNSILGSLLLLVLNVTSLCISAATSQALNITVPPLLQEGPPKGELLFVVTHDPQMDPESLTIPCKADGIPLPTYSWLKNGSPFQADSQEEIEVVEGEGTLIFRDPQPEDEGYYQCIATNSAGSVYSDISNVKRFRTISFPKGDPRVITVNLGDPLSLPCDNPGGYPIPSLHWVLQKSDGGLRSVSSERATVDENGTLWFSSVSRDDASDEALYACAASSSTSGRQLFVITDEDGTLELMSEDEPDEGEFITLDLATEYRMGNWVYLNVTIPPEVEQSQITLFERNAPPFLQHVSSPQHSLLVGDSLRLFCIYGGIPTPEVLWWREDGKEIDDDKKIEFGKGLEFLELTDENEALYHCKTRNENGQGGTHSFKVDIESKPEIVKKPGTVNRPQGQNAIFRCSAKGEPEPIITWSVNGEVLQNSHEEEISFAVLRNEDKGVVACNASNKHGYDYSTGFLNVLSLPPEFTMHPSDISGFFGQSVTLDCHAYGSPDPDITWRRISRDQDDHIIEQDISGDNEFYDITENGLIIKSLNENTAGEYECKASNKFDHVLSYATATLLKSTSVDIEVEPRHASTGHSVNMTCSVLGDSPLIGEVVWMKDNAPLDISDERLTMISEINAFEIGQKYSLNEDDNETESYYVQMLTLDNVNGKDSGVYSCFAKTQVDEDEDSAILLVEDVPDPPHIKEVKCSSTVAYIHWGQGAENNTPILKYIIEVETNVNPGMWEELDNEIKGSLDSIGVDLRPSLTHTFRVIAVNRVGASDPSEPSGTCVAPGVAPYENPANVSIIPLDSSAFHITWKAMEPETHNGKGFRYEVLWKQEGEDQDELQTKQEPDSETISKQTIVEDDTLSQWSRISIKDWRQNETRIDGLLRNVKYDIKVSAANEHGFAPQPGSINVYSGADVPRASPTRLRVRRITSSSAILAWIPISEEDILGPLSGYEVELRKEDQDADGNETGKGEITEIFMNQRSSTAAFRNLEPYTRYYVRVRARNINFPGPYSEPISFVTAQSASSQVTNLKVYPVSSSSLLVGWEPPLEPRGKISSYIVQYKLLYDDQDIQETNFVEEIFCNVEDRMVKLYDLDEETKYEITVIPRNSAGAGRKSSVIAKTSQTEPKIPAKPKFTWRVLPKERPTTSTEAPQLILTTKGEKTMFLYDSDGDGDIDKDDIIDSDKDGDIDKNDFEAADIDNDGDVDMDDVRAADKDHDGDVDMDDIGDRDGDGDFDANDVLIADSDGDGDIDNEDSINQNVILVDLDMDGDIDEDDVVDVDGDGDIDEEDIYALDMNNDGQIDVADLKIADLDNDGDVDASDMRDFDGDGLFDKEDFFITDRDGDGDIDQRDYQLRNTFLGDTNKDGVVDNNDAMDLDGDGDIDQDDVKIADINNDGDLSFLDILASDRDGDGILDANDIGDEDNDGDVDVDDLLIADEDNDGDIDASDDDGEGILIVDANNDGKFDISEVSDIDKDGDVDIDDFSVLDINNDGKIDDIDMQVIDRDGDGDVDQADVIDFDSDGKIDKDDLKIVDKDGDGDIDIIDVANQNTYLGDVNQDGVIDRKDVLDLDGDGDVDSEDFKAADLNDDGFVNEDDLKAYDRDNDGDIDRADAMDIDGDGRLEKEDITVRDRDGDGDTDAKDVALRRIFLADTDKDGDIDEDDVIDLDGDGDVDSSDIEASDINKDGVINSSDIAAGDVDKDGDIDFSDIGDENNDSIIDLKDLLEADKDGDGDIDSADDDGEVMLLYDRDGDGDIDNDDAGDVDGDNDVDDDDFAALDIDNDGDIDMDDVRKADRDQDGDIDAADILDFNGDGIINGLDIIAGDKDQDGDIDYLDGELKFKILKDVNKDGIIDHNDVIDTDWDGDIDHEDIAVADINNDGRVDALDIQAGDRDGDGEVDFEDIGDLDRDGDIDGDDVELADRDGDGDIDDEDFYDGVDVAFKWLPEIDRHPGSEFYLEYRRIGQPWRESMVEKRNLEQTVRGFDPRAVYQVRMVARDGQYKALSKIHTLGPIDQMEQKEIPPNVKPVTVNGDGDDPLLWTWFVVSVMAAVTMICVVFFSIWVYHQRMGKLAERRAQLYEGYQPPASTEEEEAAKNPDLETGLTSGDKEEEPLTAEKQRQQMAALMRRQETVQSVDSFASHDDDFAEYGDESMTLDLLNSVSLITNKENRQ